MALAITLAWSGAAADDAGSGPVEKKPPECQLLELASLDMATEANGGVAIPASIEGREGLLVVDTGSVYSVIGESDARARNLTIRESGRLLFYMGGVPLFQMTRPETLTIGPMVGNGMQIMVIDSDQLDHDAMGMLAPDIMANYDVEFDFAAGKFKLFDPKHCPGQVVYWTHQPYAAVPMDLDEGGHVIISVMLNGKQISAAVDTGADRSTISMDLAKSVFGVDEHDPQMTSLGNVSINGTTPAPLYRYPFDTLTLEGVTVQKPVIDILVGSRFNAGDNEMVLGIKTLRQLHMYIAYKEKMIYFTPAEAR